MEKMNIIWNDKHSIQKRYGIGLKGLTYKEKRPDKIVIDLEEVKEYHDNIHEMFHYWYNFILPVVHTADKKGNIKIVMERE